MQRRVAADHRCAFAVANALGPGFLAKVYETPLVLELRAAGMAVAQQRVAQIGYRGAVVWTFTADLVVERSVIVELKAVRALDDGHRAQCINYLKATRLPVCLLIDFGNAKLQIKRPVS